MLSLAKGFYDYLNQKDEYTILVLGLAGSGKTTLTEKVKEAYTGQPGPDPKTIQPTVGVNIRKINIDKAQVKLLDLGGDEQLRDIWKAYYTPCHAIIFVIDLLKPDRLPQDLDALKGLMLQPELTDIPVAILGNKSEIETAFPIENIKEQVNKLLDIIGDRDFRVFPVSAISSNGLSYAVSWVYHRMRDRKDLHPPVSINI